VKTLCIAMLLMASACVSTNAPDPQATQRLLADMKAACGGSAWDQAKAWHERSTAEIPGMPLLENEVWHDLHSLKSAMVSKAGGRVMRAAGYNGTVAWLRGPDGQVRTVTTPRACDSSVATPISAASAGSSRIVSPPRSN